MTSDDMAGKSIAARAATYPLLLAASGCVAVLAVHAWRISSRAVDHAAPSGSHVSDVACDQSPIRFPAVGPVGSSFDQWLSAVLVLLLVTALLAYRAPRRRVATSLVLASVTVMATIAVVLAGASLGPAAVAQGAVVGPIAAVLTLFLGNVDNQYLCSGSLPVGFELARVFAIVATGSSVIAGAAESWRSQWTRLTVWLAPEIDVVIGLDKTTLPLVTQLAAEAESWTRHEDWYAIWPPRPGDLRRWMSSRPRVVALTSDKGDPMVALARSLGVKVLTVDVRQPGSMRRLVLSPSLWGPRVSLRRMYILGPDQLENKEIHDLAETVMSTPGIRHPLRDVVPRIVMRMDDSREAREWRATHFGGQPQWDQRQEHPAEWFCDAVSADELLAHALASEAIRLGSTHVVLVGDSPLVLSILDELSWRQWAQLDLVEAARLAPAPNLPEEGSELARERAPIPVTAVTLLSDAAGDLLNEWLETRAPWDGHQLQVVARPFGSADVELASDTLVADLTSHGPVGHVSVVVVDPSTGSASLARRLSHDLPGQLQVFVPSGDTRGVGPALVEGGVLRYGATWLTQQQALEDSWTALARHQHAVYRQRYGLTGPPSGDPHDRSRVTWRPWDLVAGPLQLPAFFREDNLRQLRRVMGGVAVAGYQWRRLVYGVGAPMTLPPDVQNAVARDEHARWLALRRSGGWRYGEPRNDHNRTHPLVREWDTSSAPLPDRAKQDNVAQVASILRRLRATGLQPVPERMTHRRIGTVQAAPLVEAKTWTSSGGDSLKSKVGDWWVVDDTGEGRAVDAAEFPRLYQHLAGATYLRLGEVSAHRLTEDFAFETLEGPAVGHPGDWLVCDTKSMWAVPDEHFRASYEPVAGQPDA